MKQLNLNYEGFEQYLIGRYDDRSEPDGVQYVFKFENNYGASVIKHVASLGYKEDLWELAVFKFDGDQDNQGDITYDTEITNDVIGYQTDEKIRDLLKRIKEL